MQYHLLPCWLKPLAGIRTSEQGYHKYCQPPPNTIICYSVDHNVNTLVETIGQCVNNPRVLNPFFEMYVKGKIMTFNFPFLQFSIKLSKLYFNAKIF